MLRWVNFICLQICLAMSASAEDTTVPLKTKLPREIQVGTPPDVLAQLFPGRDVPSASPVTLKVPRGTKNLALRKPVTSSESNPVLGKLSFVTDGNKEGKEDSYVELSPGLQWVQIDLERPSRLYAVYLWHYFREARGYHDVIVQVADDAAFTKNVRTLFNCDTDASAKMGIGRDRPYLDLHVGKVVDARGVLARYVRLFSDGNTTDNLNHYVEVEIFGKPAP